MAQNGWQRLGEALAGASPARREEIRQQTLNALAQTDYNLARSRKAVQEQVKRESLGETFAQIMPDVAAARHYADASLAGVNLNELTNAAGNIQEQGFRGSAVDAATAGDWGGANAQLMGVANAPVALPTVQGGMLISNRLVPGGGEVSTTPVADSQISRNLAQGQAALIRANRPPAARGGAGGEPKLGELDKIRLQNAMKDIEPMIAAARNELLANQGAAPGSAGAARAEAAQRRLADLQLQRDQIIDRFGGITPPTEWTSTTTGQTRGLAPGYTPELMEQLSAINRDRFAQGLPALTPEQTMEFRRSGAVREPAGAATAGPQRISSKAQFDRLPSGTQFIAPDGSVRVKP